MILYVQTDDDDVYITRLRYYGVTEAQRTVFYMRKYIRHNMIIFK